MMVLFGEVKQGAGNCEVVGDELVIKVGKAKEGPYILDFSGSWLGSNAVKFYWVHGKLSRFHNHPKVFNL